MRRDELLAELHKRPFVPFRVYVSDGGVFNIRHPEMLMVLRHSAVIGVPEGGDESASVRGYPKLETYTNVDLMHITRLEHLPQPDQPIA